MATPSSRWACVVTLKKSLLFGNTIRPCCMKVASVKRGRGEDERVYAAGSTFSEMPRKFSLFERWVSVR